MSGTLGNSIPGPVILVSESRLGVIKPDHSSESSDQEAVEPSSIGGPTTSHVRSPSTACWSSYVYKRVG